jgi:hypothetical protein
LTSLGAIIVCASTAEATEENPQNPIKLSANIDAIFMMNLPVQAAFPPRLRAGAGSLNISE